jgi:hypothetical protein
MHSKNVIRGLLAATALVVIGCGPDDRQFVDTDGGAPDSSNKDAPSSTNDGSRDSATDTVSTDAPTADTPAADGRPDGGRDVAIDQRTPDGTTDALPDVSTPDIASPDISTPNDVLDGTVDASYDAWDDAADATGSSDASDASDATDEVDCSTTPSPTITPSGSTAICPGKTVTLTSSAAAAYSWSTGQTTQAIVVSVAGNYSVTATDNRGCIATSAPTAVSVYPAPPTPTISASGPLSFCNGGNVTLTASSAASYLWSTGATTQSIVVTDTGSYTVTTADANGCAATSAATNVTRIVPPPGTQTFNYINGVDSFTVPECVTTINVDAYGAQGGNGTYYQGGLGGRVQATLTVVPSTAHSNRVGCMG